MKKLPVLEIFGPTIQGEGMVIGQKTMFVRTAGCDYSCSWCDSAFTWDGSAKKDIQWMTAEEVWVKLQEVGGESFSHVTISGGNPALLPQIAEFIRVLKANGIQTALETQGSKWQDWFTEIDELTISPKPPSSHMEIDEEVLRKIVERLEESGTTFSLKTVIFDEKDLTFARNLYKMFPNTSFFLQVGNEDTAEQDHQTLLMTLLKKYEWLVEEVMKDSVLKNVRVLPQLHTYIWGNKRGV